MVSLMYWSPTMGRSMHAESSLTFPGNVTSSPRHAKSNGKAESALKLTKKIFKKAYRDNKDPRMALLDQCNMPTQGVNSSPVHRLMSCRTRNLLPISTNLLYTRVEEGVKEKLKAKRQKAKCYYDQGSKSLPELEIGQEVRVAGQQNKIWEAGTCVEKLLDRSYLVEVNGGTVHRNREALRPKYDMPKTDETAVTKARPLTPAPAQTGAPAALTSTNHSEVTTSVEVSDAKQKNLSTPSRTTHTRTVRTPVRFKDYV